MGVWRGMGMDAVRFGCSGPGTGIWLNMGGWEVAGGEYGDDEGAKGWQW